MPKLTAWATGLIGLFILAVAATLLSAIIFALWGEGGENYTVFLTFVYISSSYSLLYVISGIATLFWMYGAVRNAKVLRSSFDHSPVWAVGWYFVPIANLFKPYEVMQDTFIASRGQVDGRYTKGDRTIIGWWGLHLLGYLTITGTQFMGAFESLENDDYFFFGVLEWVWFVGLSLTLVSTVLFLKILRTIYRDQMNHAQNEVEVF